MRKITKKLRAFTLVEILVTLVILAILVGITIVAINPSENINTANDTKRKADVNTVLSAVWQYNVANNGAFPTSVTTTSQVISNTAANVCADLVPTYLVKIPADPTTGSYTDCTAYNTGYSILKNATGNRITVSATLSDNTTYSLEK